MRPEQSWETYEWKRKPAGLACDAPVAAVYERLAERVPETAERVDFTVPKPEKNLGKFLAARLAQSRIADVRGLLTVDQCANKKSHAGDTGSWFLATPTHPQYTLSNEDYSLKLKHRLALSIFRVTRTASVAVKCSCGADLDEFGYHLLTCWKDGNPERTRLHNDMLDEVAAFCQACGFHGVDTENGVDHDSARRGDIVVPNWNERGGDLWLDVVTASPHQKELVGFAAMLAGLAARKAENQKDEKYRDVVLTSMPRATFIPLAMELGGTWGDRASDFFREAGRRKDGSRSEQAAFLSYWLRRFSVRFAAGVATVLPRRSGRFAGRVDGGGSSSPRSLPS
jgi:hypothetical protein